MKHMIEEEEYELLGERIETFGAVRRSHQYRDVIPVELRAEHVSMYLHYKTRLKHGNISRGEMIEMEVKMNELYERLVKEEADYTHKHDAVTNVLILSLAIFIVGALTLI